MVKAVKRYRKLPDGTYASDDYTMMGNYPNLVRALEEGGDIDFSDESLWEDDAPWDPKKGWPKEKRKGIPLGEERFFNDLPPKLALRYLEAVQKWGNKPIGDEANDNDRSYEGFSTYPNLEGIRHQEHSPSYTGGQITPGEPVYARDDDDTVLVEVEGEPWYEEEWPAEDNPDYTNWGDGLLWRQKILREIGKFSDLGWTYDPAYMERSRAFEEADSKRTDEYSKRWQERVDKYGREEAARMRDAEHPYQSEEFQQKRREERLDVLRQYVSDQEAAAALTRDPRKVV